MKFEYSSEQQEQLFEDIFRGSITPNALPVELYESISAYLLNGLDKGYGKIAIEYEVKSKALKKALSNNIYRFSGAKTFQQTYEMSLILSDKPKFKVFKENAQQIFDTYNKTYLETEYITAKGQGYSSKKWLKIDSDKKLFPYLKRVGVRDKNQSEICRPLDGIILPVDHPFWKGAGAILSHWRCRCIFEQIDKYEEPNITSDALLTEAERLADEKGLQKMFKQNPAITGNVFDKSHPYFIVPKKYKKELENNFNLAIPNSAK